MIWAVNCGYFITRYLSFKKLVSVALAAICGLVEGLCIYAPWWLKLVAMGVGVFVWYTIVRVHRTGR